LAGMEHMSQDDADLTTSFLAPHTHLCRDCNQGVSCFARTDRECANFFQGTCPDCEHAERCPGCPSCDPGWDGF
jgi:hypothetical protein